MKRSEIKRRKRAVQEFTDSDSRQEEIIENQSEVRSELDNVKTEIEDAQTEYDNFRNTPSTHSNYRNTHKRLLSLTAIIGLTDLAAQYALNTGAFPQFSPLVVLLLSACIAGVISGFTNGFFVLKVHDHRRPHRAVRIATVTSVISGAVAAVSGLVVLAARFLPLAQFDRLQGLVFGSLITTSETLPVAAGAIFFAATVLNTPRSLEKQILQLKKEISRLDEFSDWLKKQHQTVPPVVTFVKSNVAEG